MGRLIAQKSVTRKAFTLIELLVVVAILGILSALIIVSLQGSQKKAGDTDRKTKAKSLATALEQRYVATGDYPYDDNNGTGANHGINIQSQSGNGCALILNNNLVTVGTTKRYLESGETCIDKESLNHYYKSKQAAIGGSGKYFVVAWQLKNLNEAALDGSTGTGNGVYKSTNQTGGLIGAGQSGYFIAGTSGPIGIGTRLTISDLSPAAKTNYFVVYGPQ